MSMLSKLLEKLDRQGGYVADYQPEERSGLSRKLPGVASRTAGRFGAEGHVDFRKGTITYASSRIQYVENQHPEHRLVFLAGSNYIYWCATCRCTVYEEELQKLNPFLIVGSGVVKLCPFCAEWGPDGRAVGGNELSDVKVGDKLRLHYRYMPDASSGNWWAEVREW